MAPKIMIVEDDPCTRAVMSATLSRLGYDVRCAGDGREALTLLDLEPADVVITEVVMPGMDGIELIIALQGRLDAPAILAISGDGVAPARDVLRSALRLGADATMETPLSMSALVRVVGELVEIRQDLKARTARPFSLRCVA